MKRTIQLLALSLALSALIPLTAHAQIGAGVQNLAKPYLYTDSEGPGTLTIKPLSDAPTWPNWQKIEVTLEQKGVRYPGSGVYHYSRDVAPDTAPITYFWYTLQAPNGRSYFFEGKIHHTDNPKSQGSGNYWRIDQPQTPFNWTLQWKDEPQPEPYVNAAPEYTGNWQRIVSADAVNGAYYSAPNSWSGWNAQAVWSGPVPKGKYDVEVYIPAKWGGDSVGRTKSATYKITAVGPIEIKADQNVSQSGWYKLASKVGFEGSYKISLNNETGETPNGAWRVLASAVRLTYTGP